MASASELTAKEAGPSWTVGPTEDVVQALMETLVDPLLPLRVSNVPPSQDAQESIAKQMHAVVLLYNYHHRKQKPELEFLDFVNFCKLAMVLRPPLTAFLKLMMESGSIKLNESEDCFSVTEEAIKNACDIAEALDASRDVPNIQGWAISKVVVMLIDSKEENCMLKFGAVTNGVWSLIEKEIIMSPIINPGVLLEEKIGDKMKQNEASIYDDEFLQHGYDAVKEFTGISSSNLEVMGTHVTYSLSKAKSATRFYMMRYKGSFNTNEQVPLNFLVERLQGPLAEKVEFGWWKTTAVIEFYHMLPYVAFISSWLSRAESSIAGIEDLANDKRKPDEGVLVSEPSRGSFQRTDEVDMNNRYEVADSAVKETNMVNPEISDVNVDDQKKGFLSGRLSGGTVVDDDDVIEKFNQTKDGAHLLRKEENETDLQMMDIDDSEYSKDSLGGPSRELKTMKIGDSTKACTKSEDTSKKLDSIIRVYHHKRKNNPSTPNDAHARQDGAKLKVDMVDSLNLYLTQCVDEKVSGGKVDETGNRLVKFEAKANHSVEGQNLSASEDLQNALVLLYRKRQEQYSRIISMEETLALYEDNITRIRDGGDAGLARQCIKSIISGDCHLLPDHGTQKQDKGHQHGEYNSKPESGKTRFSEIYLPGKSSCQDLEHICIKNNWRLPRYLIESSDGKFVSYVVVEGKDLKLHSKGGFESKPCEARESAALQMITKIKDSCV